MRENTPKLTKIFPRLYSLSFRKLRFYRYQLQPCSIIEARITLQFFRDLHSAMIDHHNRMCCHESPLRLV